MLALSFKLCVLRPTGTRNTSTAPVVLMKCLKRVHHPGIICILYHEYWVYFLCTLHSRQCVMLFQSRERAVDISPVRGRRSQRLNTECFVMAMNCLVALMTQAIFVLALMTVPLDHIIDPAVTDLNALHCYWDDFCQNRGQGLVISLSFSIEMSQPNMTILYCIYYHSKV